MTPYYDIAVSLLKDLISTPSLSREEDKTADLIEGCFKKHGIAPNRQGNNVWAKSTHYDASKPTVLFNSHHDTVKPNKDYTLDPFSPIVDSGKLHGLGSNDAGGAAVSLLATFLHFNKQTDLPFNLILALTAEEEISGKGGVESIIDSLGNVDMAIVGEPTGMNMAIAEKGLLVIDSESKGQSGHAARSEGVNAIYKALEDITWFKNYEFEKVSPTLGKMHMNVTQIAAGTQHNVVPDSCTFTVDIRITDAYTHEEVLGIIDSKTDCIVTPRSTRLKSSGIGSDHPLLAAAKELSIKTYGSPTLSDQALIPFPSIKMGPGESERSHTADEFILLDEIEQGISKYITLIEKLKSNI